MYLTMKDKVEGPRKLVFDMCSTDDRLSASQQIFFSRYINLENVMKQHWHEHFQNTESKASLCVLWTPGSHKDQD